MDVHQPQTSAASPAVPFRALAPASPPIAPTSPLPHHESPTADSSSPFFTSTCRSRKSGSGTRVLSLRGMQSVFEVCEIGKINITYTRCSQYKCSMMVMLAAEMEVLEDRIEMMKKKHESEMNIQEANTIISNLFITKLILLNVNLTNCTSLSFCLQTYIFMHMD